MVLEGITRSRGRRAMRLYINVAGMAFGLLAVWAALLQWSSNTKADCRPL
jgi:TRAP-type C4-dicarboxylate transport system permease small subunit